MDKALQLLLLLERLYPADPQSHHSLVLHSGKLLLTLKTGGHFHSFVLDDGDLANSPDDIAAEIAALLPSRKPKNA